MIELHQFPGIRKGERSGKERGFGGIVPSGRRLRQRDFVQIVARQIVQISSHTLYHPNSPEIPSSPISPLSTLSIPVEPVPESPTPYSHLNPPPSLLLLISAAQQLNVNHPQFVPSAAHLSCRASVTEFPILELFLPAPILRYTPITPQFA